jgi:hypothetical protein
MLSQDCSPGPWARMRRRREDRETCSWCRPGRERGANPLVRVWRDAAAQRAIVRRTTRRFPRRDDPPRPCSGARHEHGSGARGPETSS